MMGALPVLDMVYAVTVASQALQGPAFMTTNPRVLLAPPPKRGSSLTIPRADGGIPLLQRLGVVQDTLRMLFIGDVTRTGAAATNPAEELLTTLHWFDANVYQATPGADNAHAITVAGPGSFSRSGKIQWRSFEWGDTEEAFGLTMCRAALSFEIPQRLA